MLRRLSNLVRPSSAFLPALLLILACGGGDSGDGPPGGGRGRGGPPGGFGGAPTPAAAVPVETTPVVRRDIAAFIETNGTLEAEEEVDIVARTAGPIVSLQAEEDDTVKAGELLARLDQDQIRAQLEVSRVALQEAETAFERAEALQRANLISAEEYDRARNSLDSARAAFRGNEIQMGYTNIRAPFGGLIVRRYVKFAETVSVNQPLFRLSDFDPLLCPIQVPERELSRLAVGQKAHLTVDAWRGERFEASVLRLSPVVDAATGTIRVTLEVEGRGKLRPGMFASVFLQTETHEDALVIPKAALALDSIGDAVFVAVDGAAARREVRLGVREGDSVEVVEGLAEGDAVISVGQDSVSDGTPITVLDGPGAGEGADAESRESGMAPDPERLERFREGMRERGLSEEEIDQRLEQMRERFGGSGPPQGRPAPGEDDSAGGDSGDSDGAADGASPAQDPSGGNG